MTGERASIVFEAYGVTAEVSVPAAAGPVPERVLPPGWRRGDAECVGARFALTAAGDVLQDGRPIPPPAPDVAGPPLDRLEAAVRAHVALQAPDHVFVHAGVVVVGGAALVIPGSSFSGKTTLVAALVRAGSAYASDEFAVLGGDGRVHPFAKPLSMRAPGRGEQTDVDPAALGGVRAAGAARVGMIVVTTYVPGAAFAPERWSASAGGLALVAHAVPARSRPAQTLATASRAAVGAQTFGGLRGDADEAASALMELASGW